MTDTIVKPLEWAPDEYDNQQALTVVDDYEISRRGKEWLVYLDQENSPRGGFLSEGDAKDFCQEDYEARILSVLDLSSYRAQIRAEALEEAGMDKIKAGTHVLVPVEPTEAMTTALLESMNIPTIENPKAAAWDSLWAYRAMITAAQEGK